MADALKREQDIQKRLDEAETRVQKTLGKKLQGRRTVNRFALRDEKLKALRLATAIENKKIKEKNEKQGDKIIEMRRQRDKEASERQEEN